MSLTDRLEDLKKKEQILKEQYIKVIGAIELVEDMLEKEKEEKKPKK